MLERILIKHFHLNTDMFDSKGNITKIGEVSYSELVDLLYKLSDLTGVDVNELVDSLDEVVGETILLGQSKCEEDGEMADNTYCNRCDNQAYVEKDRNLRKEYPYYCKNCDKNLHISETYGYVPF